jgi:tripartite-type tricarboxylate transporter receptor subunit TctC
MLTISRRTLLASACLIAFPLAAGSLAHGQPYPSKDIRIVVPSPPASPPDAASRIIATELTASEGWRVVVENRPGAIQTIGVAEVLKQPADGHTLVAMGTPTVAAPALLPKLGLRLDRDLAPVVKISTGYNVLVVNPSVPARSISELIALLKQQPGKLHFASGGLGTPAHLIGELFTQRTGTTAVHVPYPQGAQFVPDLLSGTTQFSFITTVRVVDLIAAGKLRALAVMGPDRIAVIKDVPTIAEQGFPDLITADWVGLAARTGAPDAMVARLNEAVNKALAKPAVRTALAKIGHDPAGGTPSELGQFIVSQLDHWRKVIQQAKMAGQP